MKTLLYGGTFDPPHNGHMNNLRAALALVQPDRALVMPAGTPPHKHASATPAELRLQMCACFTALSPAVQVSDWEIRRGGRSYTVHTLEWLRSQVCLVSQDVFLFGGTIRENIRYGRLEASDAEVEQAAFNPANAANFIDAMDVVLNEQFSDGAANSSNGAAGEINYSLPSGSTKLFGLIRAGAAYTPASAEQISVALEVLKDAV